MGGVQIQIPTPRNVFKTPYVSCIKNTQADVVNVSEKYKVKIHCSNCYGNDEVEIDKGKTVDEFCNDYRCPVCGCNKMTRYKGRKDRF